MQTDDLFLGAFGLVRGGELVDLEVRDLNGRPVVLFHIDGDEMQDAQREYHRGRASVDLRLLKSEVRRLKDLAFAAIRREEKERKGDEQRQGYAYPRHSRR